eukprot:9077273-Pyramimonas_sp.AAC.1
MYPFVCASQPSVCPFVCRFSFVSSSDTSRTLTKSVADQMCRPSAELSTCGRWRASACDGAPGGLREDTDGCSWTRGGSQ